MSFLKPKFVILALVGALLPALSTSGCSGDAFTTGSAAGGTGSYAGASSAAGSPGTGGVTGMACSGPEDCDDGDACTNDLCGADGTCTTAPTCAGTEKCCGGGECAQCCENSDCDDDVSCTENSCFMGQCMFVPDDAACEANEYCSTDSDCRPRQACGILTGEDTAVVCADESACTQDTCGADNFCQHDYCVRGSSNTLCCEGTGCAEECCDDSQCDKDMDPCTVGSCVMGKCESGEKPLCGDDKCCLGQDGAATCGACCSANDCDDRVQCTVDACFGGQCSHTPASARCEPGFFCDLQAGCTKADECTVATDCKKTSFCQTKASCTNGVCQFEGCALGTKCCAETAGGGSCAVCCADSECSDNIACTDDACGPAGCIHTPNDSLCGNGICDPKAGCVQCQTAANCADEFECTKDTCLSGTCVHSNACAAATPFCTLDGCAACAKDSDCQGGIITSQAAATAPGCTVSKCISGVCKTSTQLCQIGFCCPGIGCTTKGCLQ